MKADELIQHDVYEGMQVRYQVAPRFKRIMAYATDMAIIGMIMYAFVAILGLFAAMFIPLMDAVFDDFAAASTLSKVLLILALLVVMLFFMSIYHGYFIWYEYKKGRTPGKKIFGLSVISLDGKKLSLGQCIFRDVLRYIDCALMLPGLISIYLSKRGQRLGDMAAGTLVIYSQAQEDADLYLYINRDDYLLVLPYITVNAIEADTARRYLTFAYAAFIQNHSEAIMADDERAYWQEFAKENLQFKEGFALSPKDQMLFLAEYCHQFLRGKTS
ncbi:MAG: RDD family protein [Oligoflexus sp.]